MVIIEPILNFASELQIQTKISKNFLLFQLRNATSKYQLSPTRHTLRSITTYYICFVTYLNAFRFISWLLENSSLINFSTLVVNLSSHLQLSQLRSSITTSPLFKMHLVSIHILWIVLHLFHFFLIFQYIFFPHLSSFPLQITLITNWCIMHSVEQLFVMPLMSTLMPWGILSVISARKPQAQINVIRHQERYLL